MNALVSSAPEAVVAIERAKQADAEAKIKVLEGTDCRVKIKASEQVTQSHLLTKKIQKERPSQDFETAFSINKMM